MKGLSADISNLLVDSVIGRLARKTEGRGEVATRIGGLERIFNS